jgi:hypothetical protein
MIDYRKNAYVSFILNMDAFGERITFKMPNGREKHGTFCGVCVTISIYLILLLFFFSRLAMLTNYSGTEIK